MEHSPTLCFVDFECRRRKSNKKIGIKLAKVEMSRHNFRMLQHNQQKLCGNKNCYVATRLKLNSRLEVSSVATFHNFVATQNEKN